MVANQGTPSIASMDYATRAVFQDSTMTLLSRVVLLAPPVLIAAVSETES